MKILITGSNGFIGKNLVEYFEGKPEYEVYAPKRQELNLLDPEAIGMYFLEHTVDTVIHCAGDITSVHNTLQMYFNIIKQKRWYNRLINIGSGAEYCRGFPMEKIKEGTTAWPVPTDIYDFPKYIIGRDIERTQGNGVNLRVFGVYGKYEDHARRFISNNILRVLGNQNILVKQDRFFDYIYVKDLAKIIELFVNKEWINHPSYNVCWGEGLSLYNTFARIIQKVDGTNKPIVIYSDGMDREYSGDNTRFTTEFPDFKFTPHEVAIKEMYEWYKINF